VNGREPGSRAHHEGLSYGIPLVIEVFCGETSTFSRHAAKTLNGYSMRITLPRRWRKVQRKRRTGVNIKRAPPEPPAWERGRSQTWRLNLQVASHRKRVNKFLSTSPLPKDVTIAHLHTSPKCTFASRIQTVNHAMGTDLTTTMREGVSALKWCRKLHRTWRTRRKRSGVTTSCSHEAAHGCSTNLAKRLLNARETTGIGLGFPWAVSATCDRAVVQACGVGGETAGQPWLKKWTFETDHALLLETLGWYSVCRCGLTAVDHVHVLRHPGKLEVRTSLHEGTGTRVSENYPNDLGCLLAHTIAVRKLQGIAI
jgi:hypothetical protein